MTDQERGDSTSPSRLQPLDSGLLARDPVLAEIVRRLVEAYQPERIYLFGSVARGEAGPDSDYDILVVVPASDLPGYRRDQLAYRTLRGIRAAKDVLVWTREEFERRLHLPASLPATVVREGKLLYAA
jgi:predicted nucleotidyltransferase